MPDLACELCGGTGVADYNDRAAGCPDCNVPLPKLKRNMKRYKGVNKQSAKAKERNLTHKEVRKTIKEQIRYCDVCGAKREVEGLEEHHIGRNRHNETMNMCALGI